MMGLRAHHAFVPTEWRSVIRSFVFAASGVRFQPVILRLQVLLAPDAQVMMVLRVFFMRSKQTSALLYSLLGFLYALNGVAMVVVPQGWLSLFPLAFLDFSADADFAVRLLGIHYLAAAPLSFWCARNLKRCSTVRFALTLQAVGLLVVTLGAMALNPVPWSDLVSSLLLLALPALLLLGLGLPPRTVRVKGPRELGQVKWFNANKGFGFITRDNGEDVFVHYRAIRGEGHRTLREGQQVSFFLKRGEKGLQADDVEGQ